MLAEKEQDKQEQRLSRSFFLREDVVQISRDLLGKVILTQWDNQRTAGMIVETEAYRAPDDRACHAYNNRCTPRTEVMFRAGGHAYVYLCYGIHHLFNIVTAPEGTAHAVLIRAVEPIENTPLMLLRRKFPRLKTQLTAGPGVLTTALGITTSHSGLDMQASDSPIQIWDYGRPVNESDIQSGTRVGIAGAGSCAFRPWRFWIRNNKWVSKGKGL